MENRTETDWAIRNLELAGWFNQEADYGGMIGDAVKKLLETHQAEGHSGFSHGLAVKLFAKVALGEALTQQFWDEKFAEYNRYAAENNFPPWTEEAFEAHVMKKPKLPEVRGSGSEKEKTPDISAEGSDLVRSEAAHKACGDEVETSPDGRTWQRCPELPLSESENT